MSDQDNEIEEVVTPSEDGIQDEESSTSEPQSEEATSQEATEKEPPFNEHPRWRELQDERRELREQNERLQQQLVQIVNNQKPTAPQIEDKIYEANTPEEREFWQKIERIADRKAEARERKLREQFEAEKSALYTQYGQLAAKEFLKEHPDVQRGSDELKKILSLAQGKNLDLDDAYRIVMFDKAQETAAEKAKRLKQQKNKEKLAANMETKGVNKNSPVVKREEDFDSEFQRALEESGVDFS